MRASAEFTYEITDIPEAQSEFEFIALKSGNDEKDMYGNYNMGAGYAVYLNAADVTRAQNAIKQSGFEPLLAGRVKKGSKQVVIQPKNITFEGSSLGVRQ